MGIYRHPPQPFIGGHQPLEGRKRTQPTFISADNPPFGYKRRSTPIALWIPVASIIWLNGYVVQDTPVNDPPFGKRQNISAHYDAWADELPGRQRPRQLVEGIAPPAEDNPPFGQRSLLSDETARWFVEQPLPQQVRHLAEDNPPVVDDPPFASRTYLADETWRWIPEPPPFQTVRHLAESNPPPVNDPAFGQRTYLADEAHRWIPDPSPSQTVRHLAEDTQIPRGYRRPRHKRRTARHAGQSAEQVCLRDETNPHGRWQVDSGTGGLSQRIAGRLGCQEKVQLVERQSHTRIRP